jgi:hypothetical protein
MAKKKKKKKKKKRYKSVKKKEKNDREMLVRAWETKEYYAEASPFGPGRIRQTSSPQSSSSSSSPPEKRRVLPVLRNVESPPRTDGWSTVHYAAACSAIVSLEELLACCDRSTVDLQDSLGRTALAVCCAHGLESSVKVLLQHGANRYISDMSNISPIEYAVIGAHWDCVRLLLANGDYCGSTLIFEERWTRWRTLLLIVTVFMPELLPLYVERLQHLALEPDSLGRTPLHYAALAGNVEAINLLLAAQPAGRLEHSSITDGAMLPLHLAASEGNLAAVQRLLEESGGDATLVMTFLDGRKATALHHAAASMRREDLDQGSRERLRGVIRYLLSSCDEATRARLLHHPDVAGARADIILKECGEGALIAAAQHSNALGRVCEHVDYYDSYEF